MTRIARTALQYWPNIVPMRCEVRQCNIVDVFISGLTRQGKWCIMCDMCHINVGMHTNAPRYERQEDGRWLRVQG